MHRVPTLWKANAIAFISSFCVMVIELIAGRILAPHIGVSLYTWTSIIGIILAGITIGNYLGGKIADRRPSVLILVAIFFVGGLATIAILPSTKMVTSSDWFGSLPVMLDLILKTSFIFFLPAIILSLVSPMVIKLTLADLGQTGGVVGTIYACSTTGAILGTFMTGFYFILWFGTRMTIWIVATALILTGIFTWFSWRIPGKWNLSLNNFVIWATLGVIVVVYTFLFQFKESWQETYTKESNYFSIQVFNAEGDIKVLRLDQLNHSYVIPDEPTILYYDYLKVFKEIVRYVARDNPPFRILHLGGGGYSFPRYMDTIYPESVNEVIEIDPAVTKIAHEELGLSLNTKIRTYNQDARLFLIQREIDAKYDIVIGDVFNDRSTPYHLTTLEFNKLVKVNMEADGIYQVNIIDDYHNGRYLPSFIHTLRQTFNNVYLFSTVESGFATNTFVIAATDCRIDIDDFINFVTKDGEREAFVSSISEVGLDKYISLRDPILLTDDYAPTDIFVAAIFR